MHQECRCWESIEKSYGWSWAWQKLLNLEPWDHQMLQCVMGKYSSWFWRYQILSEGETEAIGANSSMEIFPAVAPLTSCPKYALGKQQQDVPLSSTYSCWAVEIRGALLGGEVDESPLRWLCMHEMCLGRFSEVVRKWSTLFCFPLRFTLLGFDWVLQKTGIYLGEVLVLLRDLLIFEAWS